MIICFALPIIGSWQKPTVMSEIFGTHRAENVISMVRSLKDLYTISEATDICVFMDGLVTGLAHLEETVADWHMGATATAAVEERKRNKKQTSRIRKHP